MSSQLINQLKALEASLNNEAQKLQALVNKGKDKAKHYRQTTEEVGSYILVYPHLSFMDL